MNNQKGSALLLIIMIMAMALFAVATIWRASVFVYELGLARQEYEQHYWSSSALMIWAIALCKENFDHFINYTEHSKQEIAIKKWPPINSLLPNKKSVGASVVLSKRSSDQITLQTIIKGQTKGRSFKCTLQRSKNAKNEEAFSIQDWCIG